MMENIIILMAATVKGSSFIQKPYQPFGDIMELIPEGNGASKITGWIA